MKARVCRGAHHSLDHGPESGCEESGRDFSPSAVLPGTEVPATCFAESIRLSCAPAIYAQARAGANKPSHDGGRCAYVVAPMSILPAIVPACAGCGVCCHLLVELLPGDDHVPEEYVVEHSGVRCMDQHGDGACVALDPETRLCTIYDQRPQTCRTFERGGELCRRILKLPAAAVMAAS